MQAIQNVIIIGSGNVASHLALAFKEKGLLISGIYSHRFENAQILAKKVDSKAFSSIEDLPIDADFYLLSVSDSALPELVKKLPAFEGLLAHTSGTVGLDVFEQRFKRAAVFYPLQTFSKEKKVNFLDVPILIESNNDEDFKRIENLGAKLSNNVSLINSEQRKQMHLAAVFASNFSNYMFHIAQELLNENGLDFSLLKPLIKETLEKIDTLSPAEAQTGPAKRKDYDTLNKQMEMLKSYPAYQNIYHLISEQIQKLNSK